MWLSNRKHHKSTVRDKELKAKLESIQCLCPASLQQELLWMARQSDLRHSLVGLRLSKLEYVGTLCQSISERGRGKLGWSAVCRELF